MKINAHGATMLTLAFNLVTNTHFVLHSFNPLPSELPGRDVVECVPVQDNVHVLDPVQVTVGEEDAPGVAGGGADQPSQPGRTRADLHHVLSLANVGLLHEQCGEALLRGPQAQVARHVEAGQAVDVQRGAEEANLEME